MSSAEELPPDDRTSGQRSFLLWLVVVAGAGLGAYLAFGLREGQCVDGPDGGYCTSYLPVYGIVLGVACLALAAYGLVRLLRR